MNSQTLGSYLAAHTQVIWGYVFEALCVSLFATTVCRLGKLDKAALLAARLAYYLLGIAVVVSFYAAAFLGYAPSWPDCILLGSFLVVQLVTSRSWKGGYPRTLATAHAKLDGAEETTSGGALHD